MMRGPAARSSAMSFRPGEDFLLGESGEFRWISYSAMLAQQLSQRGVAGQAAVAHFQGLVQCRPRLLVRFLDGTRLLTGPFARPSMMGFRPLEDLCLGELGVFRGISYSKIFVQQPSWTRSARIFRN